MLPLIKTVLLSCSIVASSVAAVAQAAEPDLQFAGALEFSDTGTLFVGDNYSGAIFALDFTAGSAPEQVVPVNIGDIDVKVADVLGVGVNALAINDMAVHPVTADIYLSVTRIGNFESAPALVRVTQDATIELVDLNSVDTQMQSLSHYPDQQTTFRPRGLGEMPPLVRDTAKGDIKLSSLAIMDMEYFQGELFVSGVAYDNFRSSLRRLPFPFSDQQVVANVEMYHISHDQYETRAPIRAMSIQKIDGKDQLVAAYTCSPIVLIDLEDIKDGAKVSARTLMDYGNGQPLDMISYSLQGQEMLFLTSNSRSPHVIPVASLNNAQTYGPDDLPRGGKSDLSPMMPVGDTGKAVMFDGMSTANSKVKRKPVCITDT